jgi:DNA-binding MarR family transcriptional regulator
MPHSTITEFADKVNEVIPVMMKEMTRRQASELYKGKITLPQMLILDLLNKNGECKMKDLARFMSVTTAAMTGIVDRLVRSGYVERVYEPNDRRIIKIRIKDKGLELAKRVNHQRRKLIIDVFGQISEADRQDYLKVLLLIRGIMQQKEAYAQ